MNFVNNKNFIKFKQDCSKSGTTEEALAVAEKIGFNTNLFASHPFKKEIKLPIYIANFVLMDYGTGAIFGCPAHDQRDLDFALKYKIPFKTVVKPFKETNDFAVKEMAYTGPGVVFNSEIVSATPEAPTG